MGNAVKPLGLSVWHGYSLLANGLLVSEVPLILRLKVFLGGQTGDDARR